MADFEQQAADRHAIALDFDREPAAPDDPRIIAVAEALRADYSLAGPVLPTIPEVDG